MKLWVLFKLSALAGFSDTTLPDEQKALPCYYQVGIDIQVPHLASITTK